MKVKVDIKLNNGNISKLVQAQKQAIEMTMEAVLSDIKTSAVTPKDTGELERSGFVDTSQLEKFIVSIIFDTPYARRLYWHPEYNFRTDKNVNAQGLWMQSYVDGEKRDFIKDTYMKFFKQLSKGLVK
ncbi:MULTISPECIES: hypothetical protein [Clostridium]|uniref:hypothetical protein n=1 Tax=Clostridium TaxID=1485 RepID=UPI00069D6F52|nr:MULTISPECIES: hypothetical protein [Clostridium]KOF56619.1 hypothetical protein AGR56_07755 [Clostridium sp. DMHC 10]MCD2348469.1 minor capsid protein [Clostridium guangxiense]